MVFNNDNDARLPVWRLRIDRQRCVRGQRGQTPHATSMLPAWRLRYRNHTECSPQPHPHPNWERWTLGPVRVRISKSRHVIYTDNKDMNSAPLINAALTVKSIDANGINLLISCV